MCTHTQSSAQVEILPSTVQKENKTSQEMLYFPQDRDNFHYTRLLKRGSSAFLVNGACMAHGMASSSQAEHRHQKETYNPLKQEHPT